MPDFLYRTEDITPSEVMNFFVETQEDRVVVNQLKGRNPTILIGSRGVGKSFLMRVAERELLDEFQASRAMPVYLSFVKSTLLRSANPDQFQYWMLARICSGILRTLEKEGLLVSNSTSSNILSGDSAKEQNSSALEQVINAFENSWKTPNLDIDTSQIPDLDAVKAAIEDLCDELKISRLVLLIDEAAHVFLPSQQRQFFTLFRDLRSFRLTCNAAVYPGVTGFGDTFQPTHDATMVTLDRNILSPSYVSSMRKIVEKQADSTLLTKISENGKNFSILAYAATGNPRILLKTVSAASKMNSNQINLVMRDFYRTNIWAEHSALAEKFLGYKPIIDWGRNFIEDNVLKELQQKNDSYIKQDKNSTSFIWIHRDAPQAVKEALRILCYSGILTEQADGIRATRGEVGRRYIVNLGCLFACESIPSVTAFDIARLLTPKRMSEYGANHQAYEALNAQHFNVNDVVEGLDLNKQLSKT